MKIIVLTDNHAGGYFGAEHGLSYFIESNDFKFLFDTGHSDLFIRNAEKSGIDIKKEVDSIVLSHGHWDHGNGLVYIPGKKLYCHSGAFIKRYRKGGMENIGLNRSREELTKIFDIAESRAPVEIFNDVYFLGEIPRDTPFESRTTLYVDENSEADFIPDDSAVAIVNNDELSVISGCAHSGIVNIVEYAMRVTGVKKLKMVAGGFHLRQRDEQTVRTIEYFRNNKPALLLPSHCTQLPALSLFYEEFGCQYLKTGDVVDF